jgi:hypothetical protein
MCDQMFQSAVCVTVRGTKRIKAWSVLLPVPSVMLIICSLYHCFCAISSVNVQFVYCSQLSMNIIILEVHIIRSTLAYTYKTRRVVILNSFGITKCF